MGKGRMRKAQQHKVKHVELSSCTKEECIY